MASQPTLREYVRKLQAWRDKYESILDRKSKRQQNLEQHAHWLVQFQYFKFDDVEVPGQYLKVT